MKNFQIQEHEIINCLKEIVAHLEKQGNERKETMKSVYMDLQKSIQYDIKSKERLEWLLTYFSGYMTKSGAFDGDPFCGGCAEKQAQYVFREGYELERLEMLLDFLGERLDDLNLKQ